MKFIGLFHPGQYSAWLQLFWATAMPPHSSTHAANSSTLRQKKAVFISFILSILFKTNHLHHPHSSRTISKDSNSPRKKQLFFSLSLPYRCKKQGVCCQGNKFFPCTPRTEGGRAAAQKAGRGRAKARSLPLLSDGKEVLTSPLSASGRCRGRQVWSSPDCR